MENILYRHETFLEVVYGLHHLIRSPTLPGYLYIRKRLVTGISSNQGSSYGTGPQ